MQHLQEVGKAVALALLDYFELNKVRGWGLLLSLLPPSSTVPLLVAALFQEDGATLTYSEAYQEVVIREEGTSSELQFVASETLRQRRQAELKKELMGDGVFETKGSEKPPQRRSLGSSVSESVLYTHQNKDDNDSLRHMLKHMVGIESPKHDATAAAPLAAATKAERLPSKGGTGRKSAPAKGKSSSHRKVKDRGGSFRLRGKYALL